MGNGERYLSKLDEVIRGCEDRYFSKEFYSCFEAEKDSFRVHAAINDILDQYEGKIADLYYNRPVGKRLRDVLSEENSRKIVPIHWKNLFKLILHMDGVRYILLPENKKKYKSVPMFRRPKKHLASIILSRLGYRLIDLNRQLEDHMQGEYKESWFDVCVIQYRDIHRYLEKYNEARSKERSEQLIAAKRVFGAFLQIRDFRNAFVWADTVQDLMDDGERIIFLRELNVIKTALSEAEKDVSGKGHIVFHWIDALRYDELDNMSFVRGTMEGGIFFENMYAPTVATHPAERAMFTGKLVIDDRSLEISEDEFPKYTLWDFLKKRGYDIAIGGWYFLRKYGILHIEHIMGDKFLIPSSIFMYQGLCRLQSKDKAFLLLHYLAETHSPCISPEHPNEYRSAVPPSESDKEALMAQFIGSARYLDGQLEWYQRFFRQAEYEFYMSDHGQVRWEPDLSVEGLHHVVFAACGNNVLQRHVRKAASIAELSDIIEAVVGAEDMDSFVENHLRGFVLLQNLDPYATRFINDLCLGIGERFSVRWNYLLQYRGVATDEDSYVRLVTGEEYYFVNGNDDINQILKPECAERIEYLRKIAGDRYYDIYKEKRFKNTKKFYQRYGLKRSENNVYI